MNKETIKYENGKYYLLQSDNEKCCSYWIEICEELFNYLINLGAFVFGMKDLEYDKSNHRKVWKF